MDNLFTAIILSIVEGLTEFLPVSSSGHLILAGDLLHFTGARASTFEVVIQLGAILAVVVLYRRRFMELVRPRPYSRFAGMRGLWLLFLTSLPAGLLGLLFHRQIKEYLFSPASVALALAVGGLCMIAVEKLRKNKKPSVLNLDAITPKVALGVGCFQCLALWPGFSRSAATIMGGMLLGAKRGIAAEYSFIAAVPIIFAACAYDLFKNLALLERADILFFAVGTTGAFISALIAIKTFVALLSRVTLIPFAIYRLALTPLVFYFMLNK